MLFFTVFKSVSKEDMESTALEILVTCISMDFMQGPYGISPVNLMISLPVATIH